MTLIEATSHQAYEPYMSKHQKGNVLWESRPRVDSAHARTCDVCHMATRLHAARGDDLART